MRTQRHATAGQLREAIDRLPRDSRIAMLRGIETNPIIVGAYTSRDGICPMLAAHRQGGRTPLIAFAEAWDAYAYRGTRRWRRPGSRRATERELRVLRCHLEASLLAEDAGAAGLAAPALANPPAPAPAPAPATASEKAPAPALAAPALAAPALAAPTLAAPAKAPAAPAPARARPGDPDRRAELGDQPGWAWTRIVRRLEDYEAVVAAVSAEASAPPADAPPSLPSAARVR